MYVAEPEDLIEGRTAENARLAAYEVFPEERMGFILEMPAEGGEGGRLDGPVAAAMLESVPRYEHQYGSSVRLLQVLGLFITAVWISADRERADAIVPIYTLSGEVEIGRAYRLGEFESLLREPALEHVREAEQERGVEG